MRFVHVADIHLDSPLRGLEAYPGAPTERLRVATRQAFDRVVDLCIEEGVDFLIIAGDLFDTDVRDFNAALAAAAQLRRLAQHDIPAYLVLGNHDSRDEMTRHVPWPPNVIVFDHKKPETIRHPSLPVAVHGMSYPKREVTENLVPAYPAPIAGCFNIGVLHTNVGGNTDHLAYAPCTVEDLVAKGYGYWALGHIHDFAILHEFPHVVYPGNTQGRHVREIGRKGCVLVTVDDQTGAWEVRDVEFRDTDLVRWFQETITLQAENDEEALLEAVRNRLREIVSVADGRLSAVRLDIAGRCAVHAQLSRDSSRQQIIANLRSLASDFGDVWVEKIAFQTQSPLDLDVLRERRDLLGQLLRDVASLADDPQPLAAVAETKELAAKLATELSLGTEGEFSLEDSARHVAWLRDAEAILLSQLTNENGSPS